MNSQNPGSDIIAVPEVDLSAPDTAYVSHVRGHWSDYVALLQLKHYGRKPVFPTEADARRAGWRGKIATIGRDVFDEHDQPARTECEATLVASALGIRNRFELQTLLQFALEADTEGRNKGLLSIARVVELMHDVPDMTAHQVFRWAETFFNAYIHDLVDRTPIKAVAMDEVIKLIWQAYQEVEGEFSDEEKRNLATLIGAYTPNMRFDLFRLPWCSQIIWRRRRTTGITATPLAWVKEGLRAELVRQRLFLASAGELEKGFITDTTIGDKPARIFGCETDNPCLQIYAFSKEAERHLGYVAACVIRRSNEQTLVCRNPRGGMELWSAVAQIRAHEQELRGVPVSGWPDLIGQRGPEGARCWFFQVNAQRLMNGALTAPEVEPTRQSLEEVWSRVAWGLADEFRGYRQAFFTERRGQTTPENITREAKMARGKEF